MPLTSDDLLDIRLLSGDNPKDVTKRVVSDDTLQRWHRMGLSICLIAYKIACVRLAKAAGNLGASGEATGMNPKVQQLRVLVDHLKDCCPEAKQVPVISVGTIDWGIDEDGSR